MAKYLADDQIRARLRLGKSVEQWLGVVQEDEKLDFLVAEDLGGKSVLKLLLE